MRARRQARSMPFAHPPPRHESATVFQPPLDDTISIGGLTVRFLVEAPDSNGTASVFECYVPANTWIPAPHSHDSFEETIYGVEGVTTWTIAGQRIEIGPGEGVCVPRGRIHGFENRGAIDAMFLTIATPGVFGATYFRELSEVLAAAAEGHSDPEAMNTVMRRHGVTPAPPTAD
jgi:quercetin dioxygenase-like cupin family protein